MVILLRSRMGLSGETGMREEVNEADF